MYMADGKSRKLTRRPYNRKGHCNWCGKKLTGRRRCWCSDKCVMEWVLRVDWKYARKKVFLRDRGKCRICGKDIVAEIKKWRGLSFWERRLHKKPSGHVDHIVPVALGGGPKGPGDNYFNNLQLLCIKCHKEKTKKDIKDIRKAKNGH